MTIQEQAFYLLKRIPSAKLTLVIDFMTMLLAEHQTDSDVIKHSYISSDAIAEELIKEFDRLRAESSKYPIEDIETAREAVLSKKYSQFMK